MSRRAVLGAVVTLALARSAGAQTADPEAEHQRGIALRNEHRDAEALAVFRGLYERTGEVRALARMALAEAALARWVEAETHLLRALGSDDAWVAQNRASLDVALGTVRQHLGSLTVHANVAGAEVFLGGQRAGALPLERPLRVPAGTLDVELRAPRYATARRTVTVRPGVDVTALDVELTVEPPETQATLVVQPVTDPTPAVPPAPEVTPLFVDPQARREREERRATWQTLATTGFVLGGAGLLTGVIALGVRESAVGTFNSNLCLLISEGPVVTANGHDCEAQYDRAGAAQTASIVGFVAGTALAAAGLAAWFVSSASSPRQAFACTPTLSSAGVVCGGRF